MQVALLMAITGLVSRNVSAKPSSTTCAGSHASSPDIQSPYALCQAVAVQMHLPQLSMHWLHEAHTGTG